MLAALIAFAALRKLSHKPDVVASYERVGVPEARLNLLAAILLVGAIGLIVGLFWGPLGVTAAIGLVGYFALAIAAHIRFRDLANMATPIVIELLSIAALVLRLASL